MVRIKTIKKNFIGILFLSASTWVLADISFADSQYVVLYDLPQPYWDIKPEQTLGEIVDQLTTNRTQQNPQLKQRLIQHIVESNQHAFINQNPNRMIAGKRLWFTTAQPNTDQKSGKTNIKLFSWGYIKAPDSE